LAPVIGGKNGWEWSYGPRTDSLAFGLWPFNEPTGVWEQSMRFKP